MPFIMKTSLLTATAKITSLAEEQPSKEWNHTDTLSMGIGLVGYSLLYPLEIINIRMSVEV